MRPAWTALHTHLMNSSSAAWCMILQIAVTTLLAHGVARAIRVAAQDQDRGSQKDRLGGQMREVPS